MFNYVNDYYVEWGTLGNYIAFANKSRATIDVACTVQDILPILSDLIITKYSFTSSSCKGSSWKPGRLMNLPKRWQNQDVNPQLLLYLIPANPLLLKTLWHISRELTVLWLEWQLTIWLKSLESLLVSSGGWVDV